MEQNKILIIEDEKEIRDSIKLLLNNDGYEFIDASDGIEGLNKLTDDLDLIILDIMMPEMDGLTVCKKIREQSAVPILFLTAKVLEIDKLAGFQLGADDYLTKPFLYV